MNKLVLKFLAIFIIGAIGGIFADQIFWPYFVERPLFNQYQLEQTPIYLTERKEVVVQENLALRGAIEKVAKTVVGVKTRTIEGEVLAGSGLVVTNDGLLVTLAELVPQGSDFAFFVDGKWPAYQILKRDLENNLALIKVGQEELKTTGFADREKLKLGERVFLAAREFSSTTPQLLVNEGIIRTFDEDLIQTNIWDNAFVAGGPIFNIEGDAVGLGAIDESGRVFAIPIAKISQFIGF